MNPLKRIRRAVADIRRVVNALRHGVERCGCGHTPALHSAAGTCGALITRVTSDGEVHQAPCSCTDLLCAPRRARGEL